MSSTNPPAGLPFKDEAFLDFMQKNNIPMDAYNVDEIARFIRINPRSPVSLEDLAKQLNTTHQIEVVPWLPNFYKLHKDVSIASCEAYKKGQIYGIDVSSGLVVHALGCQPGDNVLDVCCAPGSKFCFIADCIDHTGTLTGVDLSSQRISICKTVIKKYFHLGGLDGCAARLFLTDGSTFSILAPVSRFGTRKASMPANEKNPPAPDQNIMAPPSNTTNEDTPLQTTTTTTDEQIANQSNTSHNTTNPNTFDEPSLHIPPTPSPSITTDQATIDPGSLSPVLPRKITLIPSLPSLPDDDTSPPPQRKTKKRRKGRDKDLPNLYFSNDYSIRNTETGAVQLYDRILVDAECTLDASVRHLLLHSKTSPKINTTPELTELQRRLITNAFNLLKPGGTLVYSTCSFCVSQNEDIVMYLVDHEPTARVVPIPLPVPSQPVPWSAGCLENTVRLYPRESGTSGMFIAKIIKIPP